MIRTHILPCQLRYDVADMLNTASGHVYSNIVAKHWRLLSKKDLWLSEKSMTKLSDGRIRSKKSFLHAHSIDAAQQGFYDACRTTHALRRAGFTDTKFPYHQRKFRTTVWKNTAIRRIGNKLLLSNGRGNAVCKFELPLQLQDCLRVLEARLVFDKSARRYSWHVVVEDGKVATIAPGNNIVSADLGEIHPAVVGDEHESTIITCRERRHQQQGHAKRLASLATAIDSKTKKSSRYNKLMRTRARLNAKHRQVMRDMEHKISKAIVEVAIERKANLIVIGDVKDIADGVNKGKLCNQKISGWDHGKIGKYVEYKAAAKGISVKFQPEHYTTQTCPNCEERYKPKGRNYRCPSCGFSCHRDVVGQVNILSAYKKGEPGKIKAPTVIKHRMPYNLRLMRRRQDTGQIAISVAREGKSFREAAGF